MTQGRSATFMAEASYPARVACPGCKLAFLAVARALFACPSPSHYPILHATLIHSHTALGRHTRHSHTGMPCRHYLHTMEGSQINSVATEADGTARVSATFREAVVAHRGASDPVQAFRWVGGRAGVAQGGTLEYLCSGACMRTIPSEPIFCSPLLGSQVSRPLHNPALPPLCCAPHSPQLPVPTFTPTLLHSSSHLLLCLPCCCAPSRSKYSVYYELLLIRLASHA